jgi:acyl carrier protein
MTNRDNLSEIFKIISKSTGISSDKLDINTAMHDFERWDSVNHIKIILEIEKKFKKKINTTQMASLDSVSSIKKFLDK